MSVALKRLETEWNNSEFCTNGTNCPVSPEMHFNGVARVIYNYFHLFRQPIQALVYIAMQLFTFQFRFLQL